VNQVLKVLIHLLLVFGAFVLAYVFRIDPPLTFWLLDPTALQVLAWAALYALVAAAVEFIFHDERASWRFTSLPEVLRLLRSTALTTGLFLVIMFMSNRGFLLPRSMLPMAWVFSLAALVGVRLPFRLRHDPALKTAFFAGRGDGAPLALVGDIRHADAYLRQIAHDGDRRYRPIAILTTTASEMGQIITGVPVVGQVGELADIASVKALQTPVLPALLFLDDPIKDLGLSAEDIGRLRRRGYKLLRQPSVVEFEREDSAPTTLREMNLEEFLPRAPVTLDRAAVADFVRGKRVLVTGAGGSIGSEIARQVAHFDCAHLTLLDQSEFALFEIHRTLAGLARPDFSISAVLCNIREGDRVRDAFNAAAPDIVFHAAALKHVGLVEDHPCEGVLTNIIGTANVVTAASACGAAQMTLISSDKAVDPACVMGATKRIAESLLPVNGRETTRYCVVRFGNVLGSTGSVVPIFQAAIAAGGPVTVTHPDVERYFMTIPEAVQLVLHASAFNCEGGDLSLRKFVLDMGEPVKIVDLARQMIALTGKRPDVDIAIRFTGLRRGEKLTESLVDADETEARRLPGMSEIASIHGPFALGPELLARFTFLARLGDNRGVRELITDTLTRVRGLEPVLFEPRLRLSAGAKG
jgi:O-antigen biosynthesis protein WbqV